MEDVKREGMNECRWLNCAVKAWPRNIEQLWVPVTRAANLIRHQDACMACFVSEVSLLEYSISSESCTITIVPYFILDDHNDVQQHIWFDCCRD